MEERTCDFCGDPLGDEPIRRGEKAYCSEACAFEASRSKDCSGRTDSVMSDTNVEPLD